MAARMRLGGCSTLYAGRANSVLPQCSQRAHCQGWIGCRGPTFAPRINGLQVIEPGRTVRVASRGTNMLALAGRLMIAAAVIGACATPGRIESPALSTVTLAAARPMAVTPPAAAERRITGTSQMPSGDTLWTIERGSYAGMTLPLRFNSALGSGQDPEHFWRWPSDAGEDAGVVGWSTERFPIPVAFRRGGRSGEISASDSAAF